MSCRQSELLVFFSPLVSTGSGSFLQRDGFNLSRPFFFWFEFFWLSILETCCPPWVFLWGPLYLVMVENEKRREFFFCWSMPINLKDAGRRRLHTVGQLMGTIIARCLVRKPNNNNNNKSVFSFFLSLDANHIVICYC